MAKKVKIEELVPDDKNANKGTEEGQALLERSVGELGIGRSILIDKDGNVIAGNGVVETAAAIGMEDVIIVKTDGSTVAGLTLD